MRQETRIRLERSKVKTVPASLTKVCGTIEFFDVTKTLGE